MDGNYNFNFFNILIFSGIVYGFALSYATWQNKFIPREQRLFLILTVMALTLSNLQYWFIDIGLREKLGIHKVYHLQFELLIIQFFYLFVRSYIGRKYNKLLIRIITFIFIVGIIYQYFSFVIVENLELRTKYNIIAEIITIVYALIFLALSFKTLLDFRKAKISPKPKTKWLISTLVLGSLIIGLWILGTQLFHFKKTHLFSSYYPLWIAMSLIIYYIGHRSFHELHVYFQRIEIRNKILKDSKVSDNLDNKKKNITLFEEIVDFIENNKEYLNPDLNLQLIGENFNVSSGYVSQLFNSNSDDSFTDFVNKLRIDEVKLMLLSPDYSHYTIDAIGLEGGFKTKSNFYNAFKKHMKTTPSQFRMN